MCMCVSLPMFNTLHVHSEVHRGVVTMETAGYTLSRSCRTKERQLYDNLTVFNALSSCHVFLCYALREKKRFLLSLIPTLAPR